MNAKQESQLNMFRAVESHCNDYPSIVAILPAYQTSYHLFRSKITAISEAMQKEDLVTKGITIRKAQAKKMLCKFASEVASPIFAYAEITSNSQLKKEVSFSYSKLVQTKDESLSPRIKNIFDVATDNLAQLASYGISAITLQEFQQLIDAYSSAVPDPRNASAVKKTVRENIKNLMKESNSILKNQMDKSIVMLKKEHPDFVSTYTANRVIIDPPRGQTQLKGRVIDSITKEPLQGVTVSIDSFVAVTDAKGKYQVNNMRLGNYVLQANFSNFEPYEKTNLLIKMGRINNLNIELSPKKR